MELSLKDRLFLSNQYRILEKLYPEDAEHYGTCRTVVENGFELNYSELTRPLDENTLSRDECKEVLDILDMYSALHFSYRDLTDKAGIDSKAVQFPGFDSNNEADQLTYARFFVETLGRYEEFGGQIRNSHMPLIEAYRRMLNAWRTSEDLINLSKTDIERILAAKIQPSMRFHPSVR